MSSVWEPAASGDTEWNTKDDHGLQQGDGDGWLEGPPQGASDKCRASSTPDCVLSTREAYRSQAMNTMKTKTRTLAVVAMVMPVISRSHHGH